MNILALESSAAVLSAALLRGDRLLEREGTPGANHSDVVLPLVQALLDEAGLRLRQLDGIAFSAGPGAFTGLRLSCGVVQGLAFAHDLPVLAVGTLEALALHAGRSRVATCIDARMNEVYFAAFQLEEHGVRAVIEPCVCDPALLPLPAGDDWFACGDGLPAYGGRAMQRLAAAVRASDPALMPRASAVARLAAPRLARGEGQDAARALPLYVREKVALTTAERLARGGRA